MKDLHLEFKNATGRFPKKETTLELEESEFIENYYLVLKTDADPLADDGELTISKYTDEYVEWLESRIEETLENL